MLLVAGGLGLLALAVVWPVRGRSAAAGDRLFANREAQQRLVSAVMTGLKAMRAGGLEASRRATFATALAEGRDALLAFVRLSSLTAGLLQVAFAGAAAAFVWAALRVAGLDLASVVVFLAVLLRLAPRVSGLQSQVQELAADLSAYRAVRAFAARLAAERDPSVGAPRRPPPPLREAIRVEGLSVRLGGEEGPLALDDVSLDIPAGRLTALIGPSGSGKTTLADVVSGILSPGVGRVLVDGTPLADADRAAWRGGVAYVAQDPVLMRDTVRENLLEAEPAADDGALAEALRTAVADELVAGLPGGLDAPVGERGALLSGGERQRIAIAQALLRRPQLLVLDEATSGLDWDTQGRLADNLARVAAERGLTTLVVAHRPEAIRHADLVHVLGDGRLVESGPPARLAASGGTFAAGLLRPAGPGGAGPGDARLEGRTEAGARPQLTP
jgi:ATP-binding cassette subfamily C protein